MSFLFTKESTLISDLGPVLFLFLASLDKGSHLLVHFLNHIGLHETEENDDPEEWDREAWAEQVIDVSLEDQREDAVEEEVGDDTGEESHGRPPGVRVEADGELEVRDEDAHTVDRHATNPEAYVLAIRLHSALVVEDEQYSGENDCGMPEGIEDPLHEQSFGETFSVDSNAVEFGVVEIVIFPIVRPKLISSFIIIFLLNTIFLVTPISHWYCVSGNRIID